MIINSLNIDISDMPAAATSRKFTVVGDVGAKFRIIALQNPSSSSTHTLYYDFKSGSFESGYNDVNNNLISTLTSTTYNNKINFPSGTGDFVIKLMQLNGSTSNIITKNIAKASADATVTFTPGTSSGNAANYATLPTSTSTGAVSSTGEFSFNWDVTNSTTDAKSHGFRLLNKSIIIDDSYWYFTTTETVDGGVEPTDANLGLKVKVDDLTDIGVGSIITGVSSGSLSGTPRVTAIDTTTKTLTISSAQTFANDITLTFKAYGIKNIDKAIGLKLSFGAIKFKGNTVTSTLREDSDGDYTTSTTVRLGATLGISGGNVVGYKGEGVDNSSRNTVRSVTPDPDGSDGDGAMVVSLTQTLRKGAIITFSGCHSIVNFTGSVSITKYPTADKTINLDLEKIITLGTAL